MRPALEVADIFRAHGPAWRRAQHAHLSLGQLKAMIANSGRQENLARARELLNVAPTVAQPESVDAPTASVQPTFVCTHCGAPMIIIDTLVRAIPIRAPPLHRGAL